MEIIMKDRKALLVLDFINEIVHPDGKYAKDGYLEQITSRRTLENAAAAIERSRELGFPVIYIVVGFSENYAEWPDHSPVFNLAKSDGRIILGTWATQIHNDLAPEKYEQVVVKNRISPFFQTNLDLLLKKFNVDTLLLTGVSTEFVILSTAMSAHDRDYKVIVLEDAVASSHDKFHQAALTILARIATISTVEKALSNSRKGIL
jgi:nicotinamidase-related amidase